MHDNTSYKILLLGRYGST